MTDKGFTYKHVFVWENLSDRGISISVPTTTVDDNALHLVEDYWAIQNIDSIEWFPWWAHTVRDIARDYGVTEDAIRIISHQFPQAKVDGLVCPTCHKEYFFTSRSQFAELLKKVRDNTLGDCDPCLRAAREALRQERRESKRAFAKSHPWVMDAGNIAEIRNREPQWEVTETVTQRSSSCRACGGLLLKGMPRLTFRLAAPQHQERWGHIHTFYEAA